MSEELVFYLEPEQEYIPLCDLLKKMGLCESGGQAKAFISEGLVLVDNEIELRKRGKIRAGQKVEFNQEIIRIVSK